MKNEPKKTDSREWLHHCGPPTFTFIEDDDVLLEIRIWEGGHVACVRAYPALWDCVESNKVALNDGYGGYDCYVKPENAEVLFDVDVKWDGCANWDFMPNGILLHTCGERDVLKLHRRIQLAFEHGARAIKAEEK